MLMSLIGPRNRDLRRYDFMWAAHRPSLAAVIACKHLQALCGERQCSKKRAG